MGYMAHHAVVVTYSDWVLKEAWMPDIAGFRANLPADLRPLLVGPIPGAINAYSSWAFLPDGSKEGWDLSDDGDRARQAFADLFAVRWEDEEGSPFNVALVRFGGDEPGKLEASDPRKDWQVISYEDGKQVIRKVLAGAVLAPNELR